MRSGTSFPTPRTTAKLYRRARSYGFRPRASVSRASGTVQQARPNDRCLPAPPTECRSNGSIFDPDTAASSMRFPFGSRSHDLDQLRATLPHLGRSTTVAGLAAALTWNERRVERTVREWERLEPMRVAFDPLSRSVRLLGVPAPPTMPAQAPADAPNAPAAVPTVEAVTAAVAPPTRPRWEAVNCRSCGTPMEPTGTGSGLFCPSCGRLASGRPSTALPPLPSGPKTPLAPSPSGAPTVETSTGHAVSDRKSQEMFAAWATARPIPCPRCRAPLRHDGVGKYRCSACGESVRFSGENGAPKETGRALAPPAA
jgi:DNA-directed RNA polymerase subunit RPC12/RpoP